MKLPKITEKSLKSRQEKKVTYKLPPVDYQGIS